MFAVRNQAQSGVKIRALECLWRVRELVRRVRRRVGTFPVSPWNPTRRISRVGTRKILLRKGLRVPLRAPNRFYCAKSISYCVPPIIPLRIHTTSDSSISYEEVGNFVVMGIDPPGKLPALTHEPYNDRRQVGPVGIPRWDQACQPNEAQVPACYGWSASHRKLTLDDRWV